MPGPYKRLDTPTVNQHVVTQTVSKPKKKKTSASKAKPEEQVKVESQAKADDTTAKGAPEWDRSVTPTPASKTSSSGSDG